MTFELTNDLAKLLERTGRSAEAGSQFRDALERARERFGPGDPRTLDIIHKRAHELEPSKPAEAEPLFRQALEGYRKIQGPDGELTLDLTLDLANLLDRTGRWLAPIRPRPAVPRRPWSEARKQFGPDDPRTAGILAPLGLTSFSKASGPRPSPSCAIAWPFARRSSPTNGPPSTPAACSAAACWARKVRRGRAADRLGLRGHEGPRGQDPPPGKPRLTEAAERVVKLYEAGRKEWQSLWADVEALLERAEGHPAKAVAAASPMPAKAPEPVQNPTAAAVNTLLVDLHQAGKGVLADELTREIHRGQDIVKLYSKRANPPYTGT